MLFKLNANVTFSVLIGFALSNLTYLSPVPSKIILVFLLSIYWVKNSKINSRFAATGILLAMLGLLSISSGLHTTSILDISAILFIFLQLACLVTFISNPRDYFMGFVLGTLVYSMYSIYLFASDLAWINSSYYVFRMIAGGGVDPNVLSVGVVVSIFMLTQIELKRSLKYLALFILILSVILYFSRGALVALLLTTVVFQYNNINRYALFLLGFSLISILLFSDNLIGFLKIYVNLNSTFEGMSISSGKRLLAWERLLNEFSFTTIMLGTSFSGLSMIGNYGYTFPHSTPIAILFSFGSIYFILHYFLLLIIFIENKNLRIVITPFAICSVFVDLIYFNIVLLYFLMAKKKVSYG